MEEIYHDIELGKYWLPKRNRLLLRVLDSLLPRWIVPLAVFVAAVNLSILLEDSITFMVLSILGIPLGATMIAPVWLALIVPSGFLGLHSAINRLFALLRCSAFDGSQLLLVPALLLSKIIHVSLAHGNLSFRARLSILIASCAAIVSGGIMLWDYAGKKELLAQFILVYALEIFFFISITLNDYTKVRLRRLRQNRRPKRRRAGR